MRAATGLALGACALLWSGGAAAELGVPQLGAVQKWVCRSDGDLPRSYVTKVLGIRDDGVLIMEDQVDKQIGRLEVPAQVHGLHLYYRRVLADGSERRQTFDPAAFAGYTALEPGSEMTVDVEETDGRRSWTWKYSVRVGEPQVVSQDLFGEIEAVPVTEERWVYRDNISTTYQFFVVPDRSLVLSWSYATPEGEQSCDLYLSFKKKIRQPAE